MKARFRTLARSYEEVDPTTRVKTVFFQPAGFVDLELTEDAFGELTVVGAFTAVRKTGPKSARIILDLTHRPEVLP